jgi:type II secretory pathway component PulF
MIDATTTILAVLPFGLMAIGLIMVWVARVEEPRDHKSPIWNQVVRQFGIIALVLGLFAAIAMMTHIFFLVIWLATAVILLAIARRYYEAERQSLLWLLQTSAERGIPLDAAALAFAEDRHDRLGIQATTLADYLDAGLPLGLALQRSGHRVSPALTLAADLGQQTGSLGLALRQVAAHGESVDKTVRSTAVWFFYLSFLAIYALIIGVFCITWLIPVLLRIYSDFQLPLPPATRELVSITDLIANHWYFLIPLWMVVIIGFVAAIAHYIGFSVRQLPIIRRLWWRTDCALILRWLAIAVRQNRSLNDAVQLLAAYFPQPVIRRRLEQARRRIAGGSHWCDSLRTAGLIRSSESGLFKAAERAGNLAWALDEMADSAVRRSTYRIKAWIDFFFPLAVVAIGFAVLFLAVGVLVPIFSLVTALT